MKKLLLLLLLFPFLSFAKYYEGTITLKGGTVKNGMVDIPNHSKADKINFKANKKAKAEKIELANVTEFTIINDDKEELKYITLKLAMLKTFKKEYKIDEEVSWVKVVEEDYISIVVAYIKGVGGEVNPAYFLHKEGDDHCKYITVYYAGAVVVIGEFSNIQNMCEIIFKDDCPQLSEKLTKEAYKKDGLKAIGYLYNELCVK